MLDYLLLGVILFAVLANFIHFIYNTFKALGDTLRGLSLRLRRWLRGLLVVQVVAIKPEFRGTSEVLDGKAQEEREFEGEGMTPRSAEKIISEKDDRTVSNLI